MDNKTSGKNNSGQDTSRQKKQGGKRIFFLLLIVYCLFSYLPSVGRMLHGFWISGLERFQDSGQEEKDTYNLYSRLEIFKADLTDLTDTEEWKNGSLKETVPELEEAELSEGYRLYRFDVTVFNEGNDSSRYENQIFLGSHQGDVEQFDTHWKPDDKEKDTRIIPPQREGTIIIYGQVQDGCSEVYLRTYNTGPAEDSKLIVEIPD